MPLLRVPFARRSTVCNVSNEWRHAASSPRCDGARVCRVHGFVPPTPRVDSVCTWRTCANKSCKCAGTFGQDTTRLLAVIVGCAQPNLLHATHVSHGDRLCATCVRVRCPPRWCCQAPTPLPGLVPQSSKQQHSHARCSCPRQYSTHTNEFGAWIPPRSAWGVPYVQWLHAVPAVVGTCATDRLHSSRRIF